MSYISNSQKSNLDLVISTQEQIIIVFQSLEFYTQVVNENFVDWYVFTLELVNIVNRFTIQIEQQQKNQKTLKEKLNEVNQRVVLNNDEKNRAFEIKKQLQKNFIVARVMIIDFFDSRFLTKKLIKIIDFDKFINENKTLLKTWVIYVHIKMRLNFDHFVESNWIEINIEQVKMLYVVSRVSDKVQNHFKSQIDAITFTIIDFESWKNIIIFIK